MGSIFRLGKNWQENSDMDPEKRIVHEIVDFPKKIKNIETEGISLLTKNLKIMHVVSKKYCKIIFNEQIIQLKRTNLYIRGMTLITALILFGGTGTRFGGTIPKHYLLKPMISQSLV